MTRFTPLLLVIALGCSDSQGVPDVIPAELADTWQAGPFCLPSCGLTLSSVANPGDSLNSTAFAGITTEVRITRAGGFFLRTLPGPDTAAAGTVRHEGATLIVTDGAGVVDTLDYTLSTDVLQLRFRRTFSVIDFTGDGLPDPARARLVLVRR